MVALMQIDSLLLKNNYIEALKEISTFNPDTLNEEERALYSLFLILIQEIGEDVSSFHHHQNQHYTYWNKKIKKKLLITTCLEEKHNS